MKFSHCIDYADQESKVFLAQRDTLAIELNFNPKQFYQTFPPRVKEVNYHLLRIVISQKLAEQSEQNPPNSPC